LKRGAEQHILKTSKSSATPLSAAFLSDHVDIVMLLMEYLVAQADFDTNHPTLVLDQPLICTAACLGMRKVVEAALDHGAYINAAGIDGTALRLAASEGFLDIVSLLCERGADVNLRCDQGQSNSIEAAVAGGHVRIIKKLLKHGADMNSVSEKAQAPAVVQAAIIGKCAALQVLLQAGAHFDAALQYKSLSCAIWHLDDAAAAEVVKVLLPYCSNLDEASATDDHNALTYALSHGKLKAARALHAGGADVHYRVHDRTMAHIAAQSGSVAILKWVQSVGVDLRTPSNIAVLPLHSACCSGGLEAFKYLLDVPGAADDVHARTIQQQTPLYFAAAGGAEAVVELLLQRGAAVNVRGSAGTTPLMHAKTAAVVKLLLAAGADASAVDGTHWTVLHHYATAGASAGAVCLVLKAGADPTAGDGDGSTAAHLAGIKGHFALEALLSRAADDYRKKQTIATNSNSSSSSGSSSSSTSTGDSSTTVATASAKSSTACTGSSSTAAASVNDRSAYTQQAEVSHDATAIEQQKYRTMLQL
jgi:ankyrin repeat protein